MHECMYTYVWKHEFKAKGSRRRTLTRVLKYVSGFPR
jgi:hypothetical protein